MEGEGDIPTLRQAQEEWSCSLSLLRAKTYSPRYLELTPQAQADHIYPCAVSESCLLSLSESALWQVVREQVVAVRCD
jgi:hypothetical protein